MWLKFRIFFNRQRTIACIAAMIVFAIVSFNAKQANTTKAQYGPSATVYMVSQDVASGAALEAVQVKATPMPAKAIPSDAVTHSPIGNKSTRQLRAGDIITNRDLGPANSSGLVAQIPLDWRALTIPADSPPPNLEPGDECELWVGLVKDADVPSEPTPQAQAPVAIKLSSKARVIERLEDRITVSVAPSDVELIVGAMSQASIVVAAKGA